ncbi:S8 family serine peptidase [Jidongwangia harbinensis]|uniref:S8 family serine peptidase n=1 Tax=Jidongwangia harbinensis TaxID=2878561 RepID=UPI0027E1062F|nr:S8 family serine peptidase [Jidongwangia harbinensis]
MKRPASGRLGVRFRRAAVGLSAFTGLAIAASVGTAAGGVPVAAGPDAGAPGVWQSAGSMWGWDNRVSQGTTLTQAGQMIGADGSWSRQYTGKGVGIAMIDTGVARVPGLTSGNVVNGPDLSFESQDPATRYVDRFGHGTHLAGIMVGRDPLTGFRGIAPDAKLTSIKVAARDGAVDVVQVLAAIDWVVEHRNDDPANPIRVLNLAYGTSGTQNYRTNPLAFAVEQAWKAGIVVVVAAGNNGTGAPNLVNPAFDPYVVAVGAVDDKGTTATYDDTVSDYSSRGNPGRRVDVVAPGRSVVSLRVPGSFVDERYPSARVGTSQFKGSGTSQAAAITSAAVARLLQARPLLRPDQVKAVSRASAWRLNDADAGAGAGRLMLSQALAWPAPLTATQAFPASTGLGTLESARGDSHVTLDGVVLAGEKDIFGNPFSTALWSRASANRTAWSGGRWMGVAWTGDGWSLTHGTASWAGRAWSGRAWSGRAWSGRAWSGASWNGEWKTGS